MMRNDLVKSPAYLWHRYLQTDSSLCLEPQGICVLKLRLSVSVRPSSQWHINAALQSSDGALDRLGQLRACGCID